MARRPDGDCKQYDAEQEDVLESTLARCEAFAHMDDQKGDTHLDRERSRKKPREQPDNDADRANGPRNIAAPAKAPPGTSLFFAIMPLTPPKPGPVTFAQPCMNMM